jgi:hypothetical protein
MTALLQALSLVVAVCFTCYCISEYKYHNASLGIIAASLFICFTISVLYFDFKKAFFNKK